MFSLYITNPGAETVEAEDTTWVIMGDGGDTISEPITEDTEFSAVVAQVQQEPGEHSVIAVRRDAGTPQVHAYRGVTSSHEVFFHETPAGDAVVTDHFRNSLAHLPPDARSVPKQAVVDHLLYRARPQGTYVEEISRLGHGERLDWSIGASPTTECVAQLTSPQPIETTERAVAAIDNALQSVIDPVADAGGVATMLSGGVDSTLLHTYLPSETPTVSAAFESPEFEFEVEYAETASDHLGTNHQIVQAPETEYLERLEQTMDAICLPPHHLQTVHMDMCVRASPHDRYVNGLFADSLFGVKNAVHAYLAWLIRHGRWLLPPIGRAPALKKLAGELVRQPSDSRGRAQQFGIYTDLNATRAAVGRQRVADQQRSRCKYVQERVDLTPNRATYTAHMDWGHWIEYFCSNAASLWRHAAQAHGAELVTPFITRRLAQTALDVPPTWRYRKGLEQKHLLKTLLDERLPAYSTTKSKGSGGLPLPRYLADGPLADGFDRYAPPPIVDADRARAAMTEAPEFAWNLLTYAMWRDRVLRAKIDPLPETNIIKEI